MLVRVFRTDNCVFNYLISYQVLHLLPMCLKQNVLERNILEHSSTVRYNFISSFWGTYWSYLVSCMCKYIIFIYHLTIRSLAYNALFLSFCHHSKLSKLNLLTKRKFYKLPTLKRASYVRSNCDIIFCFSLSCWSPNDLLERNSRNSHTLSGDNMDNMIKIEVFVELKHEFVEIGFARKPGGLLK